MTFWQFLAGWAAVVIPLAGIVIWASNANSNQVRDLKDSFKYLNDKVDRLSDKVDRLVEDVAYIKGWKESLFKEPAVMTSGPYAGGSVREGTREHIEKEEDE